MPVANVGVFAVRSSSLASVVVSLPGLSDSAHHAGVQYVFWCLLYPFRKFLSFTCFCIPLNLEGAS